MSQCCGRVFHGYHFRPCPNNGKVERDGKSYCGIHDPVAVKAREDKRTAHYDALRAEDCLRWEVEKQKRARAELCVTACDWMTDEEVKMMARMSRTAFVGILYNKV